MRERWRIPIPLRRTMIDQLRRIVEDPAAGPREVTAAAKAILSASKINLANISVSVTAIKELDLEARLRQLEEDYKANNTEQEEYPAFGN